ncbi:TetR family transcriptional regulator C-terminal domain-containing protein [Streptomyces sp. NPDC051315]|uniref:TetR family transcriptional regulator C-terminal domain-containing protein n=1 Tax=Streptomyces sp. NPDC051315 TaxID=3365650 RepID=UPI0037AA9090
MTCTRRASTPRPRSSPRSRRRAAPSRRSSGRPQYCAPAPHGCLLVQGALAVGDASEPVRRALAACRAAILDAIAQRLRQGVDDGDLPADTDVADLARYVIVTSNGIAVQAAGGATRDELLRSIAVAMRAWPAAR